MEITALCILYILQSKQIKEAKKETGTETCTFSYFDYIILPFAILHLVQIEVAHTCLLHTFLLSLEFHRKESIP